MKVMNKRISIVKGVHMNNFKRVLLHVMVIAAVCLCTVSVAEGMAAKTNVKTKKIILAQGEKCTIKIKKGSRISNNNKKVAKINKKGIITGLRKGKCVINICHKNKLVKYKVTVKELKKYDDIDTSKLVNGGQGCPVYHQGYYIEKIEPKDDKTSYIYLGYNPNYIYFNENTPIKHVVIEIYNERINLEVGDYTGFFVNSDAEQEVAGDTVYYKGDINMVSLQNENSVYGQTRVAPAICYEHLKVTNINKTDSDKIYLECVPSDESKIAFNVTISDDGIKSIRIVTDNSFVQKYDIKAGDTIVYAYCSINEVQSNIYDNILQVDGGIHFTGKFIQ